MASYGIGPKYTLREGTRSSVNHKDIRIKKTLHPAIGYDYLVTQRSFNSFNPPLILAKFPCETATWNKQHSKMTPVLTGDSFMGDSKYQIQNISDSSGAEPWDHHFKARLSPRRINSWVHLHVVSGGMEAFHMGNVQWRKEAFQTMSILQFFPQKTLEKSVIIIIDTHQLRETESRVKLRKYHCINISFSFKYWYSPL